MPVVRLARVGNPVLGTMETGKQGPTNFTQTTMKMFKLAARRWRTSDVTLQTLRSNALRLYRYKSPPKKFVFVFVFAMHVFQLLCDDV